MGNDNDRARGWSPSARARLEEELAVLRARRDEFVSDHQRMRDVGDRGDEAEALQNEDALFAINQRIAEVTRLLAEGPGDVRNGSGAPDGTTATLRFDDGTTQTVRVVAIPEESPLGEEDTTVTADSPIGRALAGRRAGDAIRYQTPAGEVRAQIVALELPTV